MAGGADDSDTGLLMLAEVKWLEAGRREEERIYSRSNPCRQMRNYFLTLIRMKNVPIHSQNWVIPTCPIQTTECHLPQTAQIRHKRRFPNKHDGVNVVRRLTSGNLTATSGIDSTTYVWNVEDSNMVGYVTLHYIVSGHVTFCYDMLCYVTFRFVLNFCLLSLTL